MVEQCDVIVIGGGSSGENAADYAQKYGLSATIIESELVGGECSYWACMPSKALLRPGEVLAAARRVPAAARAVTGELDIERVLQSRDAFVSHWDDKYQVQWLESQEIPLIRGRGRLVGERTVEVSREDGSTTRLSAKRAVVIATGSRASMPPIPRLETVEPWDSRRATSAQEVPRRLLVLGGGVVGVELAQAWRRLGASEVTVVEALERLLPNEEPFAGDHVAEALEDEGIAVVTGARVTGVQRDEGGAVSARLEDGRELRGDELLVAAGRRPNTDDLGLESVGLVPGRVLEVDGRLRVRGVDGDWLYAVGDVNGRALLTHQGKYQARIVGAVLAGENTSAWADTKGAPRVVFSDPQVAAVGLTERQARQRGMTIRILRHDLAQIAGTVLRGRGISGAVQLVVDDERDVIVGATFVGPEVGEMLHAATVAMIGEVPLASLWHAVPAYPTMSEVWLRLLEDDVHR